MADTPPPQAETTKESVREGVTMALYLSLSLLAVLIALPEPPEGSGDPVWVLFITACGLLVAHLLAASIAGRLVSRGQIDHQARVVRVAQIVGGIVVIALATVPLLILNPPWSLRVSTGLLLGLVCWVGYVAARQAHGSRMRAFVYVAVVLASVLVVLVIKSLVGH